MGPQEREARNRIRALVEFSDKLINVSHEDIREQEDLLKSSIITRRKILERKLADFAGNRDATTVELNKAGRRLVKLAKSISKPDPDIENSKNELRDIAEYVGSIREVYENTRRELENVLNSRPTFGTIIDDFVKNIQTNSGQWEQMAEDIEGRYSQVVEHTIPKEFNSLESDVQENGFHILLAGSKRDPNDVQEFERDLNRLMHTKISSEKEDELE